MFLLTFPIFHVSAIFGGVQALSLNFAILGLLHQTIFHVSVIFGSVRALALNFVTLLAIASG
jgi:hypothetical protein